MEPFNCHLAKNKPENQGYVQCPHIQGFYADGKTHDFWLVGIKPLAGFPEAQLKICDECAAKQEEQLMQISIWCVRYKLGTPKDIVATIRKGKNFKPLTDRGRALKQIADQERARDN